MDEIKYAVGELVTIVDINKQGEVTAVSEDGTLFTVKYTDDAGAEQTETGPAEKFAPIDGDSQNGEGEKADEESGDKGEDAQ